MADALIVYGCSRSMNCVTLAQLSSTHEICKAAGTYPQTAADHRADSVNFITTLTHPHHVLRKQEKVNMKKIIACVAAVLFLIGGRLLSYEAGRYAEANNVAGVLWSIFLLVLSFIGIFLCIDLFFEKKDELGK